MEGTLVGANHSIWEVLDLAPDLPAVNTICQLVVAKLLDSKFSRLVQSERDGSWE